MNRRNIHSGYSVLLCCALSAVTTLIPSQLALARDDHGTPTAENLLAAQPDQDAKPGAGAAAEVQFLDGSRLKVTLTQPRVKLKTPYGELTVPLADIDRIEFGFRVSEETATRIETLITRLGNDKLAVRDEASAALQKLGYRAYPAVLRACQNDDAEVAMRARGLADKIRIEAAEGTLELPACDAVYVENGKLPGQIAGPAKWKLQTAQFGEVDLKLEDARVIEFTGKASDQLAHAAPDPGSLSQVEEQVGKTLCYKVTGAASGTVWGSDTYTVDSQLASAAVHAGVLRAGQTGAVRVRILGHQPAFQGSTRNGITSRDYSQFMGFMFVK
jgi:hypothetical protein